MSDHTFTYSKPVKTRVDHQCFGCGRNIPKGSNALYQKNIISGEFNDLWICMICNDLDKGFGIEMSMIEFYNDVLPEMYVYVFFNEYERFERDFIHHAYWGWPLKYNHREVVRNA
jgi:hypothetical protein